MDGTALVVAVVIGVIAGAASSLVTRRLGTWPGVAVGAAFAVAGIAMLAMLGVGVVVAAMLAFAVTAAILDRRPVPAA